MLPVIFAVFAKTLSEDEIYLLKHKKIYGIILFTRNIESEMQLKDLVNHIKSFNPNIKILIDEEGGRITRLKNIYPYPLPCAYELGKILQQDRNLGNKEIVKTYSLIAQRLNNLGINMVCAPVCDLLHKETHDIIGDRSFSDNIDIVTQAAQIAADTLLKHNILPIIKHIPGHGRATADSHLSLPKINSKIDILEKTDFQIFKNLADYPFAMSAHIIYDALDKKLPITLSKKAIFYIKNILGYKGKIISDDINMKALSKYSIKEITLLSYQAGCDYILHCNGDFREMSDIVTTLEEL